MSKPYMPSPDHYLHSLEPEQEYRPPRKRRWKRVVLITALILLVMIGGAAGYLWYQLAKLSINPLAFGALANDNGRTNILILGVGDPGHAGQDLSDTMMVLSIDQPDKKVAMISVPRDLRVYIPGYGYSKINAANEYGGSKLAEQVVSNTLGIPIQYYVTTDFSGLSNLVDVVGGLDVTVTQRLYDPEYPCADNQYKACGLDIEPGTYHMNGATVLEYVRCRKGTCGNDFGRAARQQQVIKLLEAKMTKSSFYLNPVNDNAILGIAQKYAKTDLSVNNMVQVGIALKESKQTINYVLSYNNFLTDIPGSSDLGPKSGNFAGIQNYVQHIFSQTSTAASSGASGGNQ